MGLESVREHLRKWGKDSDIQIFEVSSATVELAAKVLNVEEGQIAKSIGFKHPEKGALLVVVGGEHKIDNKKFKAHFGFKSRMLGFEEVESLIGHPVGGVCPFGVKSDVQVYLDISLKHYDTVYPACGNSRSSIKMTLPEMEQMTDYIQWVDIAKL